MRGIPLTLAALLLGAASSHAGPPTASTVTVHVHRKGLLFTHDVDYLMGAPISSSEFNVDQPAVDIVVRADDISVADSAVSDDVRHEIEDTMRGPRVLDAVAFPQIHFTGSQSRRRHPTSTTSPGRCRCTASPSRWRSISTEPRRTTTAA